MPSVELRWWHWATIVATDIIGPFSTDSYIPNIPSMQKSLSASDVEAGLSLQANWLAKGLATLVVGLMADSPRFGRRGALLCAFVFYVLGAYGSSAVPASQVGAKLLIAARVVQGCGESGTVVCSAIARDVLTDVRERVRVLAILGSLRPIAIVCAPSVGGLLGSVFGWRNVFRALAVWGGLLFLAVAGLPETLPDTLPREGGFKVVIRRLANTRDYEASLGVAALLILAFGFAGVLSFLSNVSPILELRFDLSVVESALLIGSIPCFIILVNIVIAKLFTKGDKAVAKSVAVLKWALVGIAFSGVCFLLAAVLRRDPLRTNPFIFMALLYLFAFAQSSTLGPSQALFLQPFGDAAGAAAGLNNVARTLISTGVAQVATDLVHTFSIRGLFFVMVFSCAACQVAWPFLVPASDVGDEDGSFSDSDAVSTHSQPNARTVPLLADTDSAV